MLQCQPSCHELKLGQLQVCESPWQHGSRGSMCIANLGLHATLSGGDVLVTSYYRSGRGNI